MEYEPGRNKKDTTEIGAIGIKKSNHETAICFPQKSLEEIRDMPSPGIEPRPQVPETCMISISPRGRREHGSSIISPKCEQRSEHIRTGDA